MRELFIESLIKKAKIDKNIILITGDLGFGVLNNFFEELPEQCINAGVAEQNMTGMSAGLALEGYNVFNYSIANFPTLRCLEQIRNDIIYHNLSVNIVAVGGGFSYGALGMSHHAIEDISIMRTFPNIRVFAPCDKVEVNAILDKMIDDPKPSYLRIDKIKNDIESKEPFVFGDLRKIRSGKKIAIIGYGSIIEEALLASEDLSKIGINCSIYSAHTIKPFNNDILLNITKNYETLIALEEHVDTGGLGNLMSNIFIENRVIPKNLIKLNLQDRYSPIIGSREFLRDYYKLNSASIVSVVKKYYK